MSKELFLLPSAKQILSYENGDIRSDEVSTVYRFHLLNVYIWIESTSRGYEVKLRGRFSDKTEKFFSPRSTVIFTCWDLPSAVFSFKCLVRDYIFLHDLSTSDSPDFDWKV